MKKIALIVALAASLMAVDKYTCKAELVEDLNTGKYKLLGGHKVYVIVDKKVQVLVALSKENMFLLQYYKTNINKANVVMDAYSSKKHMIGIYDDFKKGAYFILGQKKIAFIDCKKGVE